MTALAARAGKNAGTEAAPPSRDRAPDADRQPVEAAATGNLLLQELFSGGLRPQLEIGGTDDPEERAADALANKVLRGGPRAPCACGGSCPNCKAGGGTTTLRRSPDAVGTGSGNTARQNHARSAAFFGSGRNMDLASRAYFEPRLGTDLSQVRIHRDERTAQTARAIGAKAYTVGNNIGFARGQHNPATTAGRALMAHELAHVVLGHGGVRREGDGKGKADPQMVVVPVGANAGPLSAYPALRAALDPADYNALAAGARRRLASVSSPFGRIPAENENVASEVKVPLQKLVKPPLVAGSKASGGTAYLQDVYNLGMSGAGAGGMSVRIQQELISTWLEGEPGILLEDVTVALVDPGAKGGSAATALLFSIRGKPIQSMGGALMIADVDKALNNHFEGILASMQGDLTTLERTLSVATRARSRLTAVKDFAAKSDREIALNAFADAEKALNEETAALTGIKDAPFSGFVSSLLTEFKTYSTADFKARKDKHVQWRADNPRKETSYDFAIKQMNACQDGNWFENAMCGYGSRGAPQVVGMSNLMTGGGADQVHQLGKAYDKGQISFSQYDDAADAVATRGLIFGGVMVALTIATMGLGLVALPAEAGLGSLVLFGAGTGIVTTAGPMLASNAYTSYRDLDDPTMNAWWKGTAYSSKDIAIASAIGGGLGAAFPIAGRAMGSIFGRGATPNATALLSGKVAVPEGVVARTIGKETVELAIASEGVTIEVSKTGMKVFGPAGKNPKALLSSTTWEEMGGSAIGHGEPFEILHPSFPSRINLGQRGWGMHSPQSARPIQFGLWDELALPQGNVPTFGNADAALIPQAQPVALQGGGKMVFSGGTGPPLTMPQQPTALFGPASPFAPLATDPAEILFPGFARQPKQLMPGPQPFGLLKAPSPTIEFVGPITPPNFRNPTALAAPFKTHGANILPPTPQGGLFVLTAEGPRYVAYPGSEGFGGGITTYGTGPAQDIRMDFNARYRNFLVDPNDITFKGGRRYPMTTQTMRYGNTDLARSHGIPHADTKIVLPGQTASTYDAADYVAHPRPYNERFRRTLEGRLRKDSEMWGAYNVIGETPRISQGGFIVPEGEYIVQFAPNGKIAKAWYFPFDNLNAYNGLSGDIDQLLARYEISPAKVPTGKIGK